MAKLVNLIPFKIGYLKKETVEPELHEELEDMDISLPVKLDAFLDRTINIIKNYNLPRKKEQLILAKMVDAMGMSPSELAQAVIKLKRNKIVKK